MVAKFLVLATLWGAAAAHSAFSSQHVYKHDGPYQSAHQHGHRSGHGHGIGHVFGHEYGHSGPERQTFGRGHGHGHKAHDFQAHPKYEFEYNVEDSQTGDHKSQHESRDGDVVHGHYSLQQPDGSIRDVHYHGDDHSGFHADVKYSTQHVARQHHNHY